MIALMLRYMTNFILGGWMFDLEDHILWRLITTYDLIFKSQKKIKNGELSWYEYAAIIEPRCVNIMKDVIKYVENGDFLEYHRKNKETPEGENINGHNEKRDPSQSTSKYILEKYNQFLEVYNNAIIEIDPEKKVHELIIGFDSFVGWMHGSFEISIWIMKQNPITGDYKIDYNIALHTMYLITYKQNAGRAIDYLRQCMLENRDIFEEERNRIMGVKK